MKLAWVFDFDGTLSNSDQRKHFLEGQKKDWDGWYGAMLLDPPHVDIVKFTWIAKREKFASIICTGRDEEYRDKSEEWLFRNVVNYEKMYMRPAGDRRDDTIIKLELYKKILEDGYNPVLVFEDRNRVVGMWRNLGIRTFQVAPGAF